MSYLFTYSGVFHSKFQEESTLIRKTFLLTCWDRGDARYSAGRSLSKRLAFDDFTGEAIEVPALSEVSFGPYAS